MILGRTAATMVLIGTVGLLINEFIFQWGRSATLLFAVVSLIGFAIFGMRVLLCRSIPDGDNS